MHSDNKFEYGIYISDGVNIKIGSNVRINENVFLQGAVIGDNVLVAPYVSILSKSHNYCDVYEPMINQGDGEEAPPIISDNVWIGRNSVILPGVKIGEGSIIGACSLVNKDVAPYSVVGGVPARFIRSRK